MQPDWMAITNPGLLHRDNDHGRPLCNVATTKGLRFPAPNDWAHFRTKKHDDGTLTYPPDIRCCWRCVERLKRLGRWPFDDR